MLRLRHIAALYSVYCARSEIVDVSHATELVLFPGRTREKSKSSLHALFRARGGGGHRYSP